MLLKKNIIVGKIKFYFFLFILSQFLSSNLYSDTKINSEDFTFNLIKNGSSGLAESYMKGEFETNNLSNLIELTAKNVSLIYKFSGILDFPAVNFVKSLFF